MYDSFPPFKLLPPFNFSFFPTTFEIWENGERLRKGVYEHDITCEVLDNGTMLVRLAGIVNEENIFDKVRTTTDRIVMYTLPSNTSNEYIKMLSHLFGTTRENYNFEYNGAYACNIFMINQKISKIAFNLDNGQMVEFY